MAQLHLFDADNFIYITSTKNIRATKFTFGNIKQVTIDSIHIASLIAPYERINL